MPKQDDPEYWERLLASEGMAPINTNLPATSGTMYSVDWNDFSMCDMSDHPQPVTSNARAVNRRHDSYSRSWASRTYTGQQGVGRDTAILRLLLWAIDTQQDQELFDMLLWRYYRQTHREFTAATGRSRKYIDRWRRPMEAMISNYVATEEYPISEYSMTAALREWL